MEGSHFQKLEGAGSWVVDIVNNVITKHSGEPSHSPEGMAYMLLSLSTSLVFFFSLQIKSLVEAVLHH